MVLGSALWAMLVAGIAGPAWSVLEDRERYRMLKYLYVSPATFLVLLVGRGGARLATGAMGTVVALVFAVIVLGLRVDLAAVDWPLLVVALVMGLVPIIALGVLLAAVCLQTRQESWSYPDAFAGALFLVSGVVFPLAVLPYAVQALGLVNPITWWLAGVRLAVVPDGPSSIGGTGSLWTAVTGTAAPDATTVLCRLVRDRGAGYTRGDRDLPVERATCPRPGPARPDHRLVAIRSGAARPGAGTPQRGSSHADLRGKPPPGLRGGLPLDRRLPRRPRHARHPAARGPGRVHRPGPRGRRGRDVGVVGDAWAS